MSTKYILAAIGLAFVRAGEVLVAHSEQFDDNDNLVNPISNERLGLDDNTTSKIPAAPTPAAQITPTQIANAELDKGGLPWDARIHAGTKTKTQKGDWTRKKGVDDAVFDAVIAELRQQYPAAAPVAAVATVTAPAAPVTASVPAISVPAPAAPVTPYAQLTDWLAKNTGDGKPLTSAWVNDQFTANSTSLAALAANQEASAQFLEAFRGVLKQMGVAEA